MINAGVVGNLGRDPEVTFNEGRAMCKFSLASNKKRKGEEQTTWVNVTAWGKLGELCGEYLSKGRQACVFGELVAREYTGKDGVTRTSIDLEANNIQFLGSKGEGQRSGNPGGDVFGS